MHSPCQRKAARRLQCAPWKSRTTEAALDLVQHKAPSEQTLIKSLNDPEHGPCALEALCAYRPTSEKSFAAVRKAIRGNPLMSWSLIDSLNRLPWYNGLRAFLSLPDVPTASTSVYPFYILARNKILWPTDMSGHIYDYHVKGMYAMVPTARTKAWRRAHPSVSAVVEQIHNKLDRPDPEPFALLFSILLFGGIAPLKSSMLGLQTLVLKQSPSRVRDVAALTLAHIHTPHIRETVL